MSLQCHLHGLTPSFALTVKFPSLGMNQFSHSVATAGFCHLSVPKQLGVGQAKARHGMKGGMQHKNRDWTLQPFPLESPWSYRPTLAPPVRQREYYTKLPSLRCKPSHLQHISLCSSTAMFDSQSHKLPNRH